MYEDDTVTELIAHEIEHLGGATQGVGVLSVDAHAFTRGLA